MQRIHIGRFDPATKLGQRVTVTGELVERWSLGRGTAGVIADETASAASAASINFTSDKKLSDYADAGDLVAVTGVVAVDRNDMKFVLEQPFIARTTPQAGRHASSRLMSRVRKDAAANSPNRARTSPKSKRYLPRHNGPVPPRVLVIVGKDSQAQHDVQSSLKKGHGLTQTTWQYPRSMRNAESIAQAIREARDVDFIALVRGGGGWRDWSAICEEPVLQALSESAVPVLSALGHSSDKTPIDLFAIRHYDTPNELGTAMANWKPYIEPAPAESALPGDVDAKLEPDARRSRDAANTGAAALTTVPGVCANKSHFEWCREQSISRVTFQHLVTTLAMFVVGGAIAIVVQLLGYMLAAQLVLATTVVLVVWRLVRLARCRHILQRTPSPREKQRADRGTILPVGSQPWVDAWQSARTIYGLRRVKLAEKSL